MNIQKSIEEIKEAIHEMIDYKLFVNSSFRKIACARAIENLEMDLENLDEMLKVARGNNVMILQYIKTLEYLNKSLSKARSYMNEYNAEAADIDNEEDELYMQDMELQRLEF